MTARPVIHPDIDTVAGITMFHLMEELYPICRSITGDGNRKTLEILKKHIPLNIVEVPTGTKVFDWTVPKEWNIRDAYVKNSEGERIIDFNKSNLHVLNYSIPVRKKMDLTELKQHLFTIPDYPDWIPYLTSYYRENWGFCLSHNQYSSLKKDTYEVCIDSSLEAGSLSYGEFFIKGESDDEILFSCYICHPSLCNDNLSGVVLLTLLAKQLFDRQSLKYSYRFLFIPETIGAITWLSLNETKTKKIVGGIVATCAGDRGHSTYQKSRELESYINNIVIKTLEDSCTEFSIRDFVPFGSDERQFSSPGFNIQIGSLMRTPYGEENFPEYHTSADNPGFISPDCLADSLKKYLDIIFVLENDETYLNLNPYCEPQLGRRGVYNSIGGQRADNIMQFSMLWVLNFSDSKHSLLDIAIKSGIKFCDIRKAADTLLSCGLLLPKSK
jgi:aminopeptidase-like protein